MDSLAEKSPTILTPPAPRRRPSIARRVWFLVIAGLAALAAAHGALWWETLRAAEGIVRARMEVTALQYASALSVDETGQVHVDAGRMGSLNRPTADGTTGAMILVGGRAVWSSKVLRDGTFPTVPLRARRPPSPSDSGFGPHPEDFSLGHPGTSDNVHLLSWPVLLSSPGTPAGCPDASTPSPAERTSGSAPASTSTSTSPADQSAPCAPVSLVALVLVVERDPLGDARLSGARDAIFLSFCAAFVAIGLAQIIALRLVLWPVRRLTKDMKRLAQGKSTRLEDNNRPEELAPLVTLFNQLLDHETTAADLNRKALANLAHSFKTPLAIMSTILQDTSHPAAPSESSPSVFTDSAAAQMHEQVLRLTDLVSHYLAAATAPGSHFGASVPLEPLAAAVAEGLEKIHRRRGIYCEFDLADNLSLPFAEGDANELLGNLLDNAFKWSKSRVALSARVIQAPAPRSPRPALLPAWAYSTIQFTGTHWPRLLRPPSLRPRPSEWLMLTVEDDGPGVPAERRQDVFQRGVRADERVPGHGVGLSIVEDLVRSRGGSVVVDASPLGGARFVVLLPLIALSDGSASAPPPA